MNRINLFGNHNRNSIRNTPAQNGAQRHSVSWGKLDLGKTNLGKINLAKTNFEKTLGTIVFAALLVACAITVGCSSDSPKPSAPTAQTQPIAPPPVTSVAPPVLQAEVKPAAKKVVRKRPATVTYADKTYGVSFEYPRRYAIETGDSANSLVASNALPMNFVHDGGSALAAVELPETGFSNTDFSSAFFNVSVNKTISQEDCGKFSVPEPVPSTSAPAAAASITPASEPAAQTANTETAPEAAAAEVPSPESAKTEPAKAADPAAQAENAQKVATETPASPEPTPVTTQSFSEMEMGKTEAVAGDGNRQSDSKYYHVFKNGACYEFALNVNTIAAQQDGGMKHIDRDKVFGKLENILATVKIAPVEPVKEAAASTAGK